MAKNVIKGLDKVLKDLKAFGEDAEIEISGITKETAQQIKADAIVNVARVAFNNGKIGQSIYTQKEGKLNQKIIVGLDYGAYVEFGTGAKVKVPAELQKVASAIRKNNTKGTFKKGLQSIRDWCKKKGIDESVAYPIFMSILNKGLTPRPYFYPAFVKGRETYLKDLEDLLEDLTKKV